MPPRFGPRARAPRNRTFQARSRMPLPTDPAADALLAALAAAGDIAYDWDVRSDAITWHGPVETMLGLADAGVVDSGRAFIGRINPEDLPQRQHRLSELA